MLPLLVLLLLLLLYNIIVIIIVVYYYIVYNNNIYIIPLPLWLTSLSCHQYDNFGLLNIPYITPYNHNQPTKLLAYELQHKVYNIATIIYLLLHCTYVYGYVCNLSLFSLFFFTSGGWQWCPALSLGPKVQQSGALWDTDLGWAEGGSGWATKISNATTPLNC